MSRVHPDEIRPHVVELVAKIDDLKRQLALLQKKCAHGRAQMDGATIMCCACGKAWGSIIEANQDLAEPCRHLNATYRYGQVLNDERWQCPDCGLWLDEDPNEGK